jgi:type III secretory pathway component EscU
MRACIFFFICISSPGRILRRLFGDDVCQLCCSLFVCLLQELELFADLGMLYFIAAVLSYAFQDHDVASHILMKKKMFIPCNFEYGQV